MKKPSVEFLPLARKPRPGKPDPEAMAVQVLAFLAADGERLERFMSLTGFEPTSLRRAAAAPGFTRAMMAYLAEDEGLLVAFAAEAGFDPEVVGAAARAAAGSGGEAFA